jgi:ribosomal protein L35
MKRSKSAAQRFRFWSPNGVKDASAQKSHPQHLTIAPHWLRKQTAIQAS